MDLRNKRSVHSIQHTNSLVQRLNQLSGSALGIGAEHGKVTPCHEALAGAAHNHCPDTLVRSQLPDSGEERARHRGVNGVEGRRPVKAEGGHSTVALEQQRSISGHGVILNLKRRRTRGMHGTGGYPQQPRPPDQAPEKSARQTSMTFYAAARRAVAPKPATASGPESSFRGTMLGATVFSSTIGLRIPKPSSRA